MVVHEVVNESEGRKWQVVKCGEGRYSVSYFEFYQAIGWRCLCVEENWSKGAVEFEFGVSVA